jgi:hypothetical protein
MTDPCDEILARVLLGEALDAAGAAHVQSCPRCGAEEPVVRALARALEADVAPAPPPGLHARVLGAAAPLLAEARHPAWHGLAARAIAAALLLLPFVVGVDALVVRAVQRVLAEWLPAALETYLVVHLVALLTLALALTYAAVPLLAERQARPGRREAHA